MPEGGHGGFGGFGGGRMGSGLVRGGGGGDDSYDALDYAEDLPLARHHRHRRRKQHILEAPPHPERGPHVGPTSRKKRRKGGRY